MSSFRLNPPASHNHEICTEDGNGNGYDDAEDSEMTPMLMWIGRNVNVNRK